MYCFFYMIVGIESTAHTFGIGVVHRKKILANVRDMYVPSSGGIVPMEAAKHHRVVAASVYGAALQQAGISERDIRGIAFSYAPGLAPCLYAGKEFVVALSRRLGVGVIPVHHSVAHLEIGRSLGAKDPVLLYASGANTQIIAYASGRYRIFGETLDIGVGNFIDKVARLFGIPFPGGPEVEKLALGGGYIGLPYTIKGMDVSFSGMQTKIQQLFVKGCKKEDLCFSLQEIAFAMLVEASERAMAHTGKKELVLGGGVGCNMRLQKMCRLMCAARGARFFCPSKDLLVDNGAMIAFTGELMNNAISAEILAIEPRLRTDEVLVDWR